MSHTNSTTNYNLPQFLPTDKPAWLTDVNAAYASIDIGMHNAQTKADTAFTDAGNAQADATTAINNAAAADAKASGALASIEATFDPTIIYPVGSKVIYNSLLYRCTVAVATPGPWTGSDNWERINVDSLIATADSKIGLLTSLSTTDKTSIVNAVNEVNGKVNAVMPKQVYKNLSWETVHSFVAEVNTLYLLTADSGNDLAIARIFSNGITNLGVVSGSKITGLSYENGRLKVSTNNCGMVAIQLA